MTLAKITLASTLTLMSFNAQAGKYTDALSKCLVSSTTQEDKTALIRWIFGAVANHPQVSDISNITPQSWDSITKDAANVFQNLIAVKCANESREALLNEGTAGYKKAFETLGATAFTGLMDDPKVAGAIGGLEKHLSEEKILKALMTGKSQ